MRASININYVSLIIVGLCFLIFVLGIWERKKDISRTVNKIELDNTIFKVFSLDGKEVEYNFESIDIETRAMKDKDSNISTTKYLLYIKEATQKKKKIFYVNTYGVLNEFLAFYNYLGYIKKGIQYEELEDNQVLEMIHEATYGKKENVALAKYKALLILGYAFLFLIGACFFNIGMRFYSLIKLDKVQAVVTNFEDWSYLGNDLNWVKDTNVKVTYEYKDKEYTKILYNDQYFGNKVGNKKSIYVNPDNPEFFDYFHLGIDEVSIIFGFGVLAYVFLFMYKKKVNELDLNK